MIESHIRVMYHGCSYPTSYYPDKVTWVRVTRLGFARVGLTRVEVWPGSELLTSWMHTFCWCEVGGLVVHHAGTMGEERCSWDSVHPMREEGWCRYWLKEEHNLLYTSQACLLIMIDLIVGKEHM
jgi:hypothetical protein